MLSGDWVKSNMNYLPPQKLLDVLEPAYAPCPGFSSTCRSVARWCPASGHFPRGFIGALGDLDEVQVVIVVAEPGDPFSSDGSGYELWPCELIAQTCRATFEHYDEGKNLFHRNMRFLLNCIFGEMPLEKQLVRTWITESMLCSAPKETGSVPSTVTRECGERYLSRQLALLNRCPIIALGRKAQQRLKYLKNVDVTLSKRIIGAYAAAPPGCNHKPARSSWECAARKVRERLHTTV